MPSWHTSSPRHSHAASCIQQPETQVKQNLYWKGRKENKHYSQYLTYDTGSITETSPSVFVISWRRKKDRKKKSSAHFSRVLCQVCDDSDIQWWSHLSIMNHVTGSHGVFDQESTFEAALTSQHKENARLCGRGICPSSSVCPYL